MSSVGLPVRHVPIKFLRPQTYPVPYVLTRISLKKPIILFEIKNEIYTHLPCLSSEVHRFQDSYFKRTIRQLLLPTLLWPNLRHSPGISLEGLRKTMKNLSE